MRYLWVLDTVSSLLVSEDVCISFGYTEFS
jgi:hypothetical protein